jgi:hypothetical protein
MEAPDSGGSVIAAFAENSFLKIVLTVTLILTTLSSYINGARKNLATANTLKRRYGFGGRFWRILGLPSLIHLIVASGALIVSLLEALLLAQQHVMGGSYPTWVSPAVANVLDGISAFFWLIFLVVSLLYIAFKLNWLESLAGLLSGASANARESLDWINAKWQQRRDPAERNIIAPSGAAIKRAADRLVMEVTQRARSNSLAIRPRGLSDANAPNVLYFGHVIEEYDVRIPWTPFYEALAALAETKDAPLSPESIRNFVGGNGFFSVLLRANDQLPSESRIPNTPGLEQAVEKAFATLRTEFHSDALGFAVGKQTDYDNVLKSSAKFLSKDGMRRQFAKLFILWNLKRSATHPPAFKVPFSDRIFMKHADEGIIRTRGARFDTGSTEVQNCFEDIQGLLIRKVASLIEATKDAERVKWRAAERKDIVARNLDWTWWLLYRADVQTYHDASGYASANWTKEDRELVRKTAEPPTASDERDEPDPADASG